MFCKRLLFLSLACASVLSFTACDIDQTQEGELPEVDVEGGRLPEYEVEPADVDIEMEEKEILVPDVDIDMPDDDPDTVEP